MFQTERNDIIAAFKKQEFPVLVATDVAARGLDIPHIRNVVNFDVARDIDTHTHRVSIVCESSIVMIILMFAVTQHNIPRRQDAYYGHHLILEGKGQLSTGPFEL